MIISCNNCLLKRSLLCFKANKVHQSSGRKASIFSFASDRDPTEADNMPVHRHIKKDHRRATLLYACGLNATGALGLLQRNKKKPLSLSTYPHRIWLGDLRISLAGCGYGYTVLATKKRDMVKVYGMGINTESQLGYHTDLKHLEVEQNSNKFYDFIMEPSPIPIPFQNHRKTTVQQVSCGRAHTLILTDKEGIFSFGSNAYGQCGRRIIDGEIYQGSRKIHQIHHNHFSSPVVQVCCGMDHSLFLTEDGKVYSCGWGADGQTGLGHYQKVSTPTLLTGELKDVRVKKVSTFADMSIAICENGQLYGWGNSEYFQLGSITEETQVNIPTRLPFDELGRIVDVAAGGTICCALNEDGEVWVWGYGILGKGPKLSDSKYPQQIPMTLFGKSTFNPKVKVVKVRSGMNHFAAVNNNGELFTWGKNTSGCLGIAKLQNQFFPWKVITPGPVQDVHCGVDHTIIMTRSIV